VGVKVVVQEKVVVVGSGGGRKGSSLSLSVFLHKRTSQ